MQILPATSAELGNHKYVEIEPGIYACPGSGRVLFVSEDENAILVIKNECAEAMP